MGAFDFIGDLMNHDARDRAARAQRDAIDVYGRMNTEIGAEQADDNLANLNPDARAAQMNALNQMAGVAGAGGLDPQSLATMQQATMATNQNAKSNTDAALERASAAGRLNSGRALSAQIQAQQGAANTNAMAGTQAVSDARNRALNAMAGAGALGGNIRGQDIQTGNARNMANQFNAQMRQGAAQQSFNNEATRARGVAEGDQALAGTNLERAQQARESAGAIGDALVTGATAAATGGISAMMPKAPAAPDTGGDVTPATRMYANGGVVDSVENDTVPAMLSPGEAVIPASAMADGPEAAKKFIQDLFRSRR